jgi:hypothetical protein
MFETNSAVWKGMRILLLALVGINSACNRSDKGVGPVLDRYQHLGHRIDLASESIGRTFSTPHEPLPMTLMAAKKDITAPRATVEADPEIEFRVEGVVVNDKTPLVMTTHGVAGLGEEVDGFKVVNIQSDAVTFTDRRGHSIKVSLYKEGASP